MSAHALRLGAVAAAVILVGVIGINLLPGTRPAGAGVPGAASPRTGPSSSLDLGAPGAANGPIAFSAYAADPDHEGPVAELPDRDIRLVAEGQGARRIIGTDSERLDQVCPALSADGTRLAFGEAERLGDAGYRDAALVIADLDADGNAAEAQRIQVGGTFDPPCATWSPDGRRVALRVGAWPLDGRPPFGGEVWIVTLDGGQVTVLPDLRASDLEWSPDGLLLAIAPAPVDSFLARGDEVLRVYSTATGELTTLPGPPGVESVSWSPDGRSIAYQHVKNAGAISSEGGVLAGTRKQEIWVVSADGDEQVLQTDTFEAIHGIGPVWSPDGKVIVYQRICATNPVSPYRPCREQHEVVLLTPGASSSGARAAGSEVVLPHLRLAGSAGPANWFPYFVTWSPDGEKLLYLAWPEPASPIDPAAADGAAWQGAALIAVPVDPLTSPTLLYEGRDMYDLAGSQSWGREPPE